MTTTMATAAAELPKPKSPQPLTKRQRHGQSLSKRVYSFEYLHAEGYEYLADNSHIKSGYRCHYSIGECVQSIFHLHNETWNVWTHLVGSIIFIALVFYVALSNNLIDPRLPGSEAAKPTGTGPATPNAWCSVAPAPLLDHGRHTQPMLLNVIATQQSPYVRNASCAAATIPATHDAQVVAALVRQLPSLELLYARLGENVGNFSHNVATQLVQLQKELALLRTTVTQVTDGAIQMPPPLVAMVESVVPHTANVSHLLDALNAGADRTVQYAIGEARALVETLLQGLEAGAHHVGEWPIFVFLGCAIVCLTSSAMFHLFYVYSRPLYMFLSRLDYAGIALLIAGSFYPIIYYSFFCHPNVVKLYLTVITALSLFAFVFSLVPKFSTPRFIFIRTGMFLALGFFALVPITHLVIQYGIFDPHVTVPIGLLVLMGALYTVGAIIYATKFPERLLPGRFDLWFSSHQLWHCLVLAAALVHYVNAIQHYEWRWNTQCDGP